MSTKKAKYKNKFDKFSKLLEDLVASAERGKNEAVEVEDYNKANNHDFYLYGLSQVKLLFDTMFNEELKDNNNDNI